MHLDSTIGSLSPRRNSHKFCQSLAKISFRKKFLHGQPVYTCTCKQCIHFVYTHVHEHSTLGVCTCTCICYIHAHYETHVHLTLLLCLHPLLVSRRAFVALDLLHVDSFLSFILFKVGLFVFIGQFPPFLTNQLSDLCIQIHVNRLYIQMYILYTCTPVHVHGSVSYKIIICQDQQWEPNTTMRGK